MQVVWPILLVSAAFLSSANSLPVSSEHDSKDTTDGQLLNQLDTAAVVTSNEYAKQIDEDAGELLSSSISMEDTFDFKRDKFYTALENEPNTIRIRREGIPDVDRVSCHGHIENEHYDHLAHDYGSSKDYLDRAKREAVQDVASSEESEQPVKAEVVETTTVKDKSSESDESVETTTTQAPPPKENSEESGESAEKKSAARRRRETSDEEDDQDLATTTVKDKSSESDESVETTTTQAPPPKENSEESGESAEKKPAARRRRETSDEEDDQDLATTTVKNKSSESDESVETTTTQAPPPKENSEESGESAEKKPAARRRRQTTDEEDDQDLPNLLPVSGDAVVSTTDDVFKASIEDYVQGCEVIDANSKEAEANETIYVA